MAPNPSSSVSTVTQTTVVTITYPPKFSPAATCWDYATTYTLSPAGNDTLISPAGVATPTVFRGAQTTCYPAGAGRFLKTHETLITRFDSGGSPQVVFAVNLTQSFFNDKDCPRGFSPVHSVNDNVNIVYTCCPSSMTLTQFSTSAIGQVFNVCAQLAQGPATFLEPGPNATLTYTIPDQSTFNVINYPVRVGTPIAPTAPSSTQAADKSVLSPGAQAGIGVGAGICGLVLVTFVLFLLRRRHRRTTAELPATEASPTDSDYQKAELPDGHKAKPPEYREAELPGDSGAQEIRSNEIVEAYGDMDYTKPEDESATPRAELDGGWLGWEAQADSGNGTRLR